jgi:hypothetical protein
MGPPAACPSQELRHLKRPGYSPHRRRFPFVETKEDSAMPRQTPMPSFVPLVDGRPGFRLVVRARTTGARRYIWEIICDDGLAHRKVSFSTARCRSMEEAHAQSAVALDEVRRSPQ